MDSSLREDFRGAGESGPTANLLIGGELACSAVRALRKADVVTGEVERCPLSAVRIVEVV